MGLINKNMMNTGAGNNPDNPDCLCDVRSNDNMANNNVRTDGHEYRCGDAGCSDKDSDNETIAMALKLILDKLDTVEKGQEYLIKKIMK